MFYLTPMITVMWLLSASLPGCWHRQHLEVDKMNELHNIKIGPSLPKKKKKKVLIDSQLIGALLGTVYAGFLVGWLSVLYITL